jgi:hypothetical protein
MRIVDTHLHAIWMKGTDILKMSMGGVEAAVMPTPHALPWIVSGKTLIRMWNDFLDYWVSCCEVRGVDLYSTLSVPFTGVESRGVEECLKQLPEYLKRDRVVGVGEIGLNHGTQDEVRLFVKTDSAPQGINPVGGERENPVARPQGVKKSIIRKENFPMERVVLDHTAQNTLETRLKTGAMVGLSVCYDKSTPEEVAKIVAENLDKRAKLFVNSELGYDNDGYFSLPRAVLAMRMAGLKQKEIEEVAWENPKRFYKLPLD